MCRPPCRSNAPFDRCFLRLCGGGQFRNVPLKCGDGYPAKSPNMDTEELAAAHEVVNLRPSDAKTLARFLWGEEQLLALFDHAGPPIAGTTRVWTSRYQGQHVLTDAVQLFAYDTTAYGLVTYRGTTYAICCGPQLGQVLRRGLANRGGQRPTESARRRRRGVVSVRAMPFRDFRGRVRGPRACSLADIRETFGPSLHAGTIRNQMARSIPKPTCSFCGKTQDRQVRLVAGPRGVFICSACVALISEIFSGPLGGGNAPEAKGGAATALQAEIRPVARRGGGRRLWPWRARVARLA